MQERARKRTEAERKREARARRQRNRLRRYTIVASKRTRDKRRQHELTQSQTVGVPGWLKWTRTARSFRSVDSRGKLIRR